MDSAAAADWIREHLRPAGPVETFRERPWSTVLRVPLAEGCAWFKACAPIQASEPELTAQLFARWPDRVPEVLARLRQVVRRDPAPGNRSNSESSAAVA